MEAFSLLKYWRGGGGGDNFTNSNSNATIVTTATIGDEEENDNKNENDNDDGPFFDLEFSVDEDDDDDDDEAPKSDNDDDEEEDEVGEREFKFTLSSPSGSSNGPTDGEPNLSLALSPADDLFFKGKLVPIETLSPGNSDQANTKPQFPVSSLLKSATKFRVFMLGLKKSKSGNNAEKIRTEPSAESAPAKPQGKFFTVKFKVDEVPIVSLFTRDNSSRVISSAKQSSDRETTTTETTTNSSSSSSEEKRFAREVVQKYLKMVKPLYVKVSRRYGESKPRPAAGHISVKPASPPAPETESPPSAAEAPAAESLAEVVEAPAASVTAAKGGLNLPAGLRVVCKHLGKSRSASSAAIAAAPAMAAAAGTASSKRRDDSLIQQQDGIQSAILHCKRSFNAARDSEAALLAMCVSDPSKEKKPLDISRKSSDDTIHRS